MADDCGIEGFGLEVDPFSGMRVPLVEEEMRAWWESLTNFRIARIYWLLLDPRRTNIIFDFVKMTVDMLIKS